MKKITLTGILTKFVIISSIIVFVSLSVLIIRGYLNSKHQKWNSLDYNVTLNADGSMDVIETWDIVISHTNTIFKNFNLSSGVTDVKVAEIENGVEKALQKIDVEQYHVDSGCYYALQIEPSTFEIAWNVGMDNSRGNKTYKVYYTIKDAVKIYGDCTELYWQFLGNENFVSGKNVTGTIKLPNKVSNIEKLKVWAHGDLSGKINRDSEDTVSFAVRRLPKKTMLEVRIVTEENIYDGLRVFSNHDKLQSILEEEQAWADEANLERYKARVFVGIVLIILVGIFIFFYKRVKQYKKQEIELVQKYGMNIPEIEYFREIPDEKNATPARALYIETLKNNTSYMTSNEEIFTATMLDLSLKGYISLEAYDKKEFKIIFNNIENQLPEDEKLVYDILLNAKASINSAREYITTKELSAYAKKEYDIFIDKLSRMKNWAQDYHHKCGNIDAEKENIIGKLKNKSSLHSFFIYLPIFIGFCIGIARFDPNIQNPVIGSKVLVAGIVAVIAFIIGNAICYNCIGRILKRITFLSEKGYTEQQEWKGLKKYMEDYSLLKEKSVPDIVLWEKFLVYATTFGISEKVISQLKVEHPEMFDENNKFYGGCTYWTIVSSSSDGKNSFSSLSRELGKAYSTASYAWNSAHSSSSSGGGSGGGFSSGGGGRRRRRRLRRTLKNKILQNTCFL